jgi:thiol-disulfide isomerase/thioredoxin
MILWLFIISLAHFVASYVKEAEDGSVCFDNCNGHGKCIDYMCQCYSGYLGDDCRTTFIEDGHKMVPILSAGHFNLTRKNFTTGIMKNKFILVGFSAHSCHKCIVVEPEYEKVSDILTGMSIPFARVDVDQMKSISLEHEANELPALVLFNKHKSLPYRGSHTSEAIITYVEKQTSKPTIQLNSVEAVESFLTSRGESKYSISTVMVVGFFSEHTDIEEDDYEDFIEIAKDLQSREDVYFGVVLNKKICDFYKNNKTIDRTPSVVLLGEENLIYSINLNELYGTKYGLKEWIDKNAIPLVGKLTNNNFKLYEKIPLPMLMLFLDLSHEFSTSSPSKVVGGKSGNILNENLIIELRAVAKEFSDKITFVYLDGILHEDRMKSLGL